MTNPHNTITVRWAPGRAYTDVHNAITDTKNPYCHLQTQRKNENPRHKPFQGSIYNAWKNSQSSVYIDKQPIEFPTHADQVLGTLTVQQLTDTPEGTVFLRLIVPQRVKKTVKNTDEDFIQEEVFFLTFGDLRNSLSSTLQNYGGYWPIYVNGATVSFDHPPIDQVNPRETHVGFRHFKVTVNVDYPTLKDIFWTLIREHSLSFQEGLQRPPSRGHFSVTSINANYRSGKTVVVYNGRANQVPITND